MGVEVCPVHKSDIKSFHNPCIHVDTMLCAPQPKGLKRKRSEEDGSDPPTTKSYNQQRQEIFDISYEKLCRFRQAPDSSLLRYVLIYNTMHNIELEMERDGIKMNCLTTGPFMPPENCQMSTLDPPPNLHTNSEVNLPPISFPPNPFNSDMDTRPSLLPMSTPSTAISDNSFGSTNGGTVYSATEYDRCTMDFDVSQSGRMTPFVKTSSYERVESGALWTDESDRLTSLNWSSVLNFNSGSSSGVASTCSSPSSSRCSTFSSDSHAACSSCSSSSSSSTSSSSCCSSNSSSSTSSSSGISENSVDEAAFGAETSLHTLMPPTTGIPCMSSLAAGFSSSPSNSSNTSSSSGNASPASGSSPTSSEDEIFGDIDVALYDYDLLSPLSPPNVRMAPVSAEELMRSLSNSAESSNTTRRVSTPYFNRNGHLTEDREHVTSVPS